MTLFETPDAKKCKPHTPQTPTSKGASALAKKQDSDPYLSQFLLNSLGKRMENWS